MSGEKSYKVYCHTNKINGKRYIGITCRRLSARFNNGRGYKDCRYFAHAIQLYGWDGFSHDLLVDGLTKSEASNLERFFIAKYRSNDRRYGYNIKDGGFDGRGMSDEGRLSSRLAHSGKNAANARAVCVYSRDGRLVGKFDTIKEAAHFAKESFAVARRSAVLCRMTKKGHLFLFLDCRPPAKDIAKELLSTYVRPHNPGGDCAQHRSEIVVFDERGLFISEFKSVQSAASFFGVSSSCVIKSASDYHQTAGGVFFRYKRDFGETDHLLPEDVCKNRYRAASFRTVRLYDRITGAFVKEFQSVADAENFTGVKIWDSLNRRQKAAGDYVCRYKEDVGDAESLPQSELPQINPLPNRRVCVSQYSKDGRFIATFVSAMDAERRTGVSASSISQCVRGKSKSAGGFVWKYS